MVTFPKKSQKLGGVEFLLEPQFPFLLEERMETKNVKLIMMIINDYGYCDGYNENDDAENNYNDDDSDGGTSHADPQFLPQLLLKTLGIPKKFKINLFPEYSISIYKSTPVTLLRII